MGASSYKTFIEKSVTRTEKEIYLALSAMDYSIIFEKHMNIKHEPPYALNHRGITVIFTYIYLLQQLHLL